MSFVEFISRFRAEQEEKERLNKLRELSTDDLMKKWDAFDPDAKKGEPGHFWPKDGPHIEDVHRLLNERGAGYYCSV